MTSFRYRAARTDGATIRGQVDATSASSAAALLSDRGLFPVQIEAVRTSGEGTLWHRPSARARATVLESLASLVEAGVPLQRALEATESVAAGSLRHAVRRLASGVGEGASLASAMDQERALFSAVTIGLLRAGERGMGQGPALRQAAQQLEREAETAGRIRAALAYPLVLVTVGMLSVLMILLFVVPRFAELLQGIDAALPATTRALLAISRVLRAHAPLLTMSAIVVVAGGTMIVLRRRTDWHAWLLRLPVIGPIRHSLASARACRALGALLGSGVAALTALSVGKDAAGDRAIAELLGKARELVAQGSALSAALASTGAVTAVAVKLAQIGEGSGRLPVLLGRAADLDEQHAEQRLRTLVSLLEPALILGFALVVALVAAAILQAIYSVRPV